MRPVRRARRASSGPLTTSTTGSTGPSGEPSYADLREALGDPVLDAELLDRALTHRSFAYEESSTATEGEDEDTGRLEGDLLDLEPQLRDAVVLTLPFRPLCRDDCPGLCPTCGARLADDPAHQHDEPVDPRWAKLTGLRLAHDQTDD